MKTKVCLKCNRTKFETEEFFYFRKEQGCFRADCKECIAKSRKKSYIKNKVKIIKQVKKYSVENKAELAKKKKDCFNYINLQPLWMEDNLKKSDRILKGVI